MNEQDKEPVRSVVRAQARYIVISSSVFDASMLGWRKAIPEVTDPVVTPAFPEYPPGHSVQSAAVLTIFGEVSFTDHTHDAHRLEPRSFLSFWAAAMEATMSKLYGGLHFRAATEQGRCIGERVNALRLGAR